MATLSMEHEARLTVKRKLAFTASQGLVMTPRALVWLILCWIEGMVQVYVVVEFLHVTESETTN